MVQESSAALVLRAWVEPGGLRVRLIEVREAQPATTVGVAADVESACELVRDWLGELLVEPTPLR